MEDNYYKKGKDGFKSQSNLQEQRSSSTHQKQRAKAQMSGRQASCGTLKPNYNELGKGRIVEQSSSGLLVQNQMQPKHQQTASEPERSSHQEADNQQQNRISASGPIHSQNNQRRGPRQTHEHFATLNQTPKPIVHHAGLHKQSGSTTPLTHMIQRRQFEMTQFPKSNSVVSAGGQTAQNTGNPQQHVLTMNLHNPKITGVTQRMGELASRKSATHLSDAVGDCSSLSGGHSQPHSRKGSNSITGRPQITKPQGGVFQSGPEKVQKHAVMSNNFVGRSQTQIASESPQFTMNTSQKMNQFASITEQISSGRGANKHTATLSTDQLKNAAPFDQERQTNNNTQQSAQKFKNEHFSNTTTGITPLTINQQNSCGALGYGQASHFNTPSNCYQAQQQQQTLQPTANSNEIASFQRQSVPNKDSIVLPPPSDCQLNHLSQNSYEMTAPLHISTSQTPIGVAQRQGSQHSLLGNLHQHSNSTLIANLANHQAQNTSQNLLPQHQTTTVNNQSSVVNFTQHTQQAHPNLQAAVQLQQQQINIANGQQHQITSGNQLNSLSQNNNAAQGHLSASQFDISALLRQQPSVLAQPVLDFQELCSNTTHHAGHQTQAALRVSVEATTRDIDFLRQRFYAEYGCDTNDIMTLYSYWQQNFQSFVQPGNQTTAANALQIANLSSYRQTNMGHHHTITGQSGVKSNNVTAFGTKGKHHQGISTGGFHQNAHQHTTINFNSQSFDNQTMTTSHIQARSSKISRLLQGGVTTTSANNNFNNLAENNTTHNPMTTVVARVKNNNNHGEIGEGHESTEIQHFTTGSVGTGYTPFDMNQQMFFVANTLNQQQQSEHQNMKGRRTQPCLRQHSTVSNRQNCTDTVSFHRDVPTPMMQREAQGSIEGEYEKNEFSFEEPVIDGTNENSIEEEEKSLINALSFKKKITPLADGQNLHEIEQQRGWATTKQETTPSLPKYRNTARPLSKDHCGFTIQLSPINRFAPSPRSKRSIFDFHALKPNSKSILQNGIMSAKKRIRKRASTIKEGRDGGRKFIHRNLSAQSKALSLLTRTNRVDSVNSAVFRLQTALNVIYMQSGTQLASMETFKKIMPSKRGKEYDSNDHKTNTYKNNNQNNNNTDRNQSDMKRRRDKSMKGRGTSKSRKRQGSRNSRKQRLASLYRESTSSIGDESASIPIFTHTSKDRVENKQDELIHVLRPGSQVIQDAETTQDIQKLCNEIEQAEKNFTERLTQEEYQFDKQVTQQVVQAERALQESKRESRTRDKSLRGTQRDGQMNFADQTNFKAQSMSSLNQAMQQNNLLQANATQRHLNPSELYGSRDQSSLTQYVQTHDPTMAPNTERPNAQSIEMRLAMHHQTQQQKKRNIAEESSVTENAAQKPLVKIQQPKSQIKDSNKRINVVSLLDQKSEPCLLKPMKLSLDRQQIKLINAQANKVTQSAHKEPDSGVSDEHTMINKTPNVQSQNTLQSTNTMKRKLTFIKTKNINFNSLGKISGRIQPSATSTHQAAPGLRIKLQKTTNGDSTDRSGAEIRFQAQNTCQSALASHKHTGADLASRVTLASAQNNNSNTMLIKHVNQLKQNHHHLQTEQSEKGVTPDKPTGKVKYASARIKLLRVDTSQDKTNKTGQSIEHAPSDYQQANLNTGSNALHKNNLNQLSHSPSSSATSTLGGVPNTRRLVEMLINEFYRKRGKSIKTVAELKQVDTLVEFWWQSLSQQKILCKLKGKLAKTGLVEKEKHLMNFLNGTDANSLFKLQKHSTTRKYGELAVMKEQILRQALSDYLAKSA